MYVIGLTGGIASGKSTVSKMLAELGAFILDADKIAHEVMEPQKLAWYDIIKHFGEDILLSDQTINRNKLGEKIFNNENARKNLEAIMHPRIKQSLFEKITCFAQHGGNCLVLDVPLLYEVGWQDMADEIWVVYVDQDVQVQRLMERNGLSLEQAMVRIKSQMDLVEKAKYAHVVIDNNRDLSNTRSQVLTRWEQVIKLISEVRNLE